MAIMVINMVIVVCYMNSIMQQLFANECFKKQISECKLDTELVKELKVHFAV